MALTFFLSSVSANGGTGRYPPNKDRGPRLPLLCAAPAIPISVVAPLPVLLPPVYHIAYRSGSAILRDSSRAFLPADWAKNDAQNGGASPVVST
jgi:hypothetical protein